MGHVMWVMSCVSHVSRASSWCAGKATTLSMYDASSAVFSALPNDGPYEAAETADPAAAQQHFGATREIQLRAPLGSDLPVPSYR